MARLSTWFGVGLGAALLLPAAFSQIVPGRADQAARVVSLDGQVSVMRDAIPWALKEGDPVRVRELIVTGPDGSAVFELADGSTFEIYPNSHVTFRNTPGNLRDLLDLWLGRIKVHIQKFGGQPNLNRVHTPTAVISVRGTVFEVLVDEEDKTTFVMVEEGQVAVQHALLPSGEPKILNAGEYIQVHKDAPLARRGVDRDTVFKHAFRALIDAMYTAVYRTPRSGGGVSVPGSGGGPQIPGDTGATPAPGSVPGPGDVGATPPPPAPPASAP